jgi:flagellar biosynthesis/type III secretory pathway protein FliH
VELATAREMVLTSAENQLLDLAVAIAAAIVERELDKDPELYRAFVTEGIRALGATGQVTLKVSRDSYAAIVGVLGGDVANVDGVEVRVASDLSIEGLGCVAESGDSRVDMSLDGRLRAVRRALEDERRRNTEAA